MNSKALLSEQHDVVLKVAAVRSCLSLNQVFAASFACYHQPVNPSIASIRFINGIDLWLGAEGTHGCNSRPEIQLLHYPNSDERTGKQRERVKEKKKKRSERDRHRDMTRHREKERQGWRQSERERERERAQETELYNSAGSGPGEEAQRRTSTDTAAGFLEHRPNAGRCKRWFLELVD